MSAKAVAWSVLAIVAAGLIAYSVFAAFGRSRQNQAPLAGAVTARLIKSQTLEVACGACIYKMPGVEGCPLAIMIDGAPYLVEGASWPNHDYCDRTCQAIVTGTLQGDTFIATSVEEKK